MQFCELDSKGGQFTTIGQQEIATLFKSPGAPRRYKAVVIKDFVVSFPSKGPGKASFYVEYISLGEIDLAKAMFLSGPRIKVRGTFDVSRESDAASALWKIEGPVPTPHLTVDAAIRFTLGFRANTQDRRAQQNADRLLATLKRLR